ncbi:MAG: HPr kinase/phosphatase C-terminal domain-containing protein [Pseudomonadota bacterium]
MADRPSVDPDQPTDQPTIHGTAIRLDGQGVLIRGASGSGKSRLALALLAEAGCWPIQRSESPTAQKPSNDAPSVLIGDDRLIVESQEGQLMARPPATLAGLIEVRGIGLLAMPWCETAKLDLVVDLKPLEDCERLPDPRRTGVGDQELPAITVPVGDLAHQTLMVGVARRLLGT